MTELHNLPFDLRQLYYFSIAAEELNISHAAERLFIAQPPLTRQIHKLEAALGYKLFYRQAKGLRLTEAGEAALAVVRPLLEQFSQASARLTRRSETPLRIGLTTAFEQGIFEPLRHVVKTTLRRPALYERQSSPQLAAGVAQGRVDLAVVALPLQFEHDLTLTELGYEEPYILALPEIWKFGEKKGLALQDLNGKPLFWFHRAANPAFHDFSAAIFKHAGFRPVYIEEPHEHDVLLARIASGEAAGLFSRSFSAIRREGVIFRTFAESRLLTLKLGLLYPFKHAAMGGIMAAASVSALKRQNG